MIVVVTVLGLGLRESLVSSYSKVRDTTDFYALPSPEQTAVLSLGYRAAFADLLWGNLLVFYGLHMSESRRFEFAGQYLDTINALDPTFDWPYLYADTIITLQPVPPSLEDYQKAREVIERGLEALPYHTELWLTAGQYMAYLAAPHLPAELQAEWRLKGAQVMGRACELASDNANVPFHCVVAARTLSRSGHNQAMLEMLERTLAVTDDPQVQRMVYGYIERYASERERELREQRVRDLEATRERGVAFVGKDLLLALGPLTADSSCTGLVEHDQLHCATTWRAWSERREALLEREGTLAFADDASN
jgi:tetratricopeptide (TPR) repeat protein